MLLAGQHLLSPRALSTTAVEAKPAWHNPGLKICSVTMGYVCRFSVNYLRIAVKLTPLPEQHGEMPKPKHGETDLAFLKRSYSDPSMWLLLS